jgi:hypothetical protein
VQTALREQPIVDLHTHLYPPGFGTPVHNAAQAVDPAGLMLWGVDELLTYHYLVAEVFRIFPAADLGYKRFWGMSTREQADYIWKHLFRNRTPLSEACRGVITALNRLGLDPNSESLDSIRSYFAEQNPNDYIGRVMELANVERITMTNAVFDDNERNRWLQNPAIGSDSRFSAVLRIDPMVVDPPHAAERLEKWGCRGAREFLDEWLDRMNAVYIAVSLPPEFRYPEGPAREMLENVILPACEERGIPFAMMIGSRRAVNPELRDAGDMGYRADIASVTNLCAAFPNNRFLVTMLSRENQHELAVAARKFRNLLPFGCWWFLNNPSLVEEITRMRLELIGSSFVPQHSDARVLEQLIYKWDHSLTVLAKVLTDKYEDLSRSGWRVTELEIRSDAERLLRGNYLGFANR